MSPDKQTQIRDSLGQWAQNYAATIDLMEKMLALLCDEAAIDPLAYWQFAQARGRNAEHLGLVVDPSRFTVNFRGHTCFLGNSLAFRFLARLAQRPNAYVSHRALLADVWKGTVSEEAIRSVVKTLRAKLRQQRMGTLADSIDGTTRGHYALRLKSR